MQSLKFLKYDNDKENGILIEIDGRNFTQQDFSYIQQLAEIIADSGEPGSFDLGNLHITINSLKTYNVLTYLEKENYLKLSNIQNHRSRICFTINHTELIRFQSSNKVFNPIIKLLLRSYSGLFDNEININENILAARLKTTENKISESLLRLEKLEVLNYIPKKQGTQILYIQNRVENKYLVLSEEKLLERRNSEIQRMNFILNYSGQKTNCRTKILLSYFGEEQQEACGKCDVCRNNNKLLDRK